MAVAVANSLLLTDGDAAFLRVNNRSPAHALQPGEVASAVNCRFDQGKAGPRYGVACDPWGAPGVELVSAANLGVGALIWPGPITSVFNWTTLSGLVVGQKYILELGNATSFSTAAVAQGNPPNIVPGGTVITAAGQFIATATQYYLWAEDVTGAAITLSVRRLGATCAYKRFSDPGTDSDNTVLITDDWRDGAGEDGGRGRAWRIQPGNAPQAISLNGHDVWGTARLVQCDNAMILLRHGNERHYFVAADVNATTDKIKLHAAPSWAVVGIATSARVRFEPASDGAAIYGTSPPAAGNYYYAKVTNLTDVELFTDAALANKLDFDAAPAPVGKFFIELATTPLPFYGNGAPNLILQPTVGGSTAFEAGFVQMVENVTESAVASNVITAENHRFGPGESITGVANELKESTGPDVFIVWPKYVAPVDAHHFRLYTSSAAALVDDGTTGLQAVLAGQSGKALWRTSAARAPLPPCREGAYQNGRFLGILNLNGRGDLLVISDPHDFLHATLWASIIPANQGEAGNANWIVPLGDNVVLVGKDQNLVGIAGLNGPNTGWTERNITTEYNGVAPLAALQVGTDVWFAARKGMASVQRTEAGETLGVARTVSRSIPADLADIDWAQASLMCAETWNNRLFWAVPTKGQTTPVNNKVLVFNFLNQLLIATQDNVAGDLVGGVREIGPTQYALVSDAWEGSWNGDRLIPYAFAKLTVNGEERLTFASPDGLVCWLHDGWDDVGADIRSEILTRGYFGGRPVLALKGRINHDTFNPKITASIVTAGVNEETTLAGFDQLTYDRTKYLVAGVPDYDPATSTEAQFDAPRRADYSPSPEELTVARLDVHQNVTEPFYCRERGIAPQIRYVNEQGSARLASVALQARPVGVSATRES